MNRSTANFPTNRSTGSQSASKRQRSDSEATALKAYLVPRGPVNGPCEFGILLEYRDLRGCVKGCQTLQSHQRSWAQPTSISMHWLQKVSHGISYMHHGPSMNLLARVPTELQLRLQGALTPRSLRTPGRTHAANTTRLRKTTHSTRKVLNAIIVDAYARCPLHGLVISWPTLIAAR
jgi:hypothetical protein